MNITRGWHVPHETLDLKPIFHWKWGSRWLPNANEIYTQKKKCTWRTPGILRSGGI